jgi:hypothetical protein
MTVMIAVVLGNLKVIVLCLLIGFIALLAHAAKSKVSVRVPASNDSPAA